jgi:hypothetical protein
MGESPTERGLSEPIDALGPEVRALPSVPDLADEDRVARIGELWAQTLHAATRRIADRGWVRQASFQVLRRRVR